VVSSVASLSCKYSVVLHPNMPKLLSPDGLVEIQYVLDQSDEQVRIHVDDDFSTDMLPPEYLMLRGNPD
jgi:hypothetical protein